MKSKLLNKRLGLKGVYNIHDELWWHSELEEPTEITYCYTPGGDKIGNVVDTAYICNDRGIVPRPRLDADVGEGKQCRIGFCEKEQKWYGWSHRAMFGFGVGSSVVKGDCAYVGATPEDLITAHEDFWGDLSPERKKQARDECQILPDRSGIRILHTPVMIAMANSLDDVVDPDLDLSELEEIDIHEENPYTIVKCGRGEWEAKTLEDAKVMAQDFAAGVA